MQSCITNLLDSVSKIVAIVVPIITVIYVVKGYRLAAERWGKDIKDHDRKEEKEQREKYFNMLDKYIANNNSGLSEFYEILMASGRSIDYIVELYGDHARERRARPADTIEKECKYLRSNLENLQQLNKKT